MKHNPKHLEERKLHGQKEFSPTAERNTPPLIEKLSRLWPDNAHVLEIASGTGQHAAAFCSDRPDITWQTSDPDLNARQSQNAWAKDFDGRIKSSLEIDVTQDNWWADLRRFDAMFCANMIHIAPYSSVAGLAAGALHILPKNHEFYLYGPFLEGKETAESNLKFDATLKNRDADWGVRDLSDVKHIFATYGLNLSKRVVMPKENRLLVFKRS